MSNIHKYDGYSNIHNFFFHPLHRKSEQKLKAVLAVISNIFMTVITVGIWQVPFWAVNLKDRKATILKKGFSSPHPTQPASKTPAPQPHSTQQTSTSTADAPVEENPLPPPPSSSKVPTDERENPSPPPETPPLVSKSTSTPEKSPSVMSPREFDGELFKQSVKGWEQNKVFLPSTFDMSSVVLQEKHKKILKSESAYRIIEEKKAGHVEVLSWTMNMLIIAFPDIPGVVFKLKLFNLGSTYHVKKGPPTDGSIDREGQKVFGAQAGEKICKEHNLFLLQIPKTAFIEIDDTSEVIVQERFDCPFPTWQDQEKIYSFIQKESDLKDYSEELLRQLILFTVVSGFSNTKYDKTPILPNGRIVLHEMELGRVQTKDRNFEVKSGEYGLYGSGCFEEAGVFSHILDPRKESLEKYAEEVKALYCPKIG